MKHFVRFLKWILFLRRSCLEPINYRFVFVDHPLLYTRFKSQSTMNPPAEPGLLPPSPASTKHVSKSEKLSCLNQKVRASTRPPRICPTITEQEQKTEVDILYMYRSKQGEITCSHIEACLIDRAWVRFRLHAATVIWSRRLNCSRFPGTRVILIGMHLPRWPLYLNRTGTTSSFVLGKIRLQDRMLSRMDHRYRNIKNSIFQEQSRLFTSQCSSELHPVSVQTVCNHEIYKNIKMATLPAWL